MDDLVAVAKLIKTRGLKGEVVCDILTDFPERFDDLDEVVAVMPDGRRSELKIEDHFFQNGRVILKIVGFDSIESGETLRGAEICVAETDVVELDQGEFFEWQLAGCVVETIDGTPVGEVIELMRTGGTELLVVKGDAKEYLIPFAEAICVEVDIENKLIRVDPPDGLLEF
ncbi:MAG: 16S rRNA processing protein RimM [Pyrinomonadaceae bacterium]|nr:16S rRNA processing protein RimM [Pyrinomonadaceae bacterium]